MLHICNVSAGLGHVQKHLIGQFLSGLGVSEGTFEHEIEEQWIALEDLVQGPSLCGTDHALSHQLGRPDNEIDGG